LKKRRLIILLSALAAVIVIIAIVALIASRQRVARRRVFQAAPAETKAKPPSADVRPLEEWSEQFRYLGAAERWSDLDALLDKLEQQHADLYAQNSLAYLHARARIENDDASGAAKKLAPFLAAGNPYRDLALYHQAELDEANGDHAAASAHRTELIVTAPSSLYRDEALDDETTWRASLKDPKPLLELSARVYASAPTARRRDLDAHVVEALARSGDLNGALARGLALLRGGTTDDPSDRVSRALDRPELLRRMTAQQWVMLGESFQSHRHYDRAVAVLSLALGGPPPAPVKATMLAVKKKAKAPRPSPRLRHPSPGGRGGKKIPLPAGEGGRRPGEGPGAAAKPPAIDRNDLLFSIGRSWFGAENYANARQTYLRGANETRDLRWKSTFLWHAARAAQLQNDDAAAEQLMTQSISVPGRFASTSAALTQRLRTRLKQKRVAQAAADLNAIRAGWPHDHAVVEASLAWAIYMIAANNDGAALGALNAIPRALLDKYDVPEIDYWRARALERSNPHAAFETYLNVLRASVPTHFAYFARARLESSAMAPRVSQELATREQQIAQLIAAKKFEDARRVATDRILLSSRDRAAELKRLASIYMELPAYRNILQLQPSPTPRFPLQPNADRASRLMAMGLFDEAIDDIPHRYPLAPASAALTQSLALNRGGASRESIYAIEVLMNGVPRDYLPGLLPMSVRELLYPRYFFGFITEDAKKFDADPTLVLSIMREESRFNPRAKSQAAARGLLQFIITTARDIGRDVGLVDVQPEDLYDPRVIIRLGAKYISELTGKFGGDRYKAAAAYNAGPNQVALWSRLAPAAGEDFFLSSINFDETKHYVRKVMNSYARYGEIYGGSGPVGGMRAEP
jgi:soluble lytic murein transglycosylase-like protein